MKQIVFLAVLIATIYLMSKTKKQVPDGQMSQDPLSGKEKLIIWILCFLNPIIAGTIFYYGWKKKLPIKAKSANQISLWAFFILIVFGVLVVFSGLAPMKKTQPATPTPMVQQPTSKTEPTMPVQPASTSSDNSYNLNMDISADVAMINIASEAAKKWRLDAQAYTVSMFDEEINLINDHLIAFKSNSNTGKLFMVQIDADNKIVDSSEEAGVAEKNIYINTANLKISSAKAFQISNDFAKGKTKGVATDYNKSLILSYVKDASKNTWIYTMTNKKVANDVVRVFVDASSGQILGTN